MMHFEQNDPIDPIDRILPVTVNGGGPLALQVGGAVSDGSVLAGSAEVEAGSISVDPSVLRRDGCVCDFVEAPSLTCGVHAILLVVQFVKNKIINDEIAVAHALCARLADIIFRHNPNVARSRYQSGREAYVG